MNDTIQTITIPDLSSSEYASDLNGVFTNINNNFAILANQDFVKGSPGGSVEIREVKFFNDNGSINEYGESLQTCIRKYANVEDGDEINDLNNHTVWDNFTSDTAGSLYMIYNIDNSAGSSVETPVASLQYVFKDGRFSNNDLGQLSAESIGSEVDLSCVVVYDKSLNNEAGGFKVLNNSISTLYYDENLGFCWKINGVETGLPAQGLPGKDGLNSSIEVAKATKTFIIDDAGNNTGEYYYKVDELFDSISGFVDVDNNTNISKYVGRTALVLVDTTVQYQTPTETPTENESEVEVINETELEVEVPTENESETPTGIITLSNYYFGKFYTEENTLRVKLTTTEPINTNVLFTGVTDYMKNIGTNSNFGSAPGLFLPINVNDNRTEESVHLMTTAAITTNRGDTISGNNNDLLLFPVNDIDSYRNDVTIEKYLYVKVNDGNSVVNKYFDNGESFNYVLKYKLDGIENSSFEGDSNLVFGKIETFDDYNNIRTIELNKDNTKYIKYDEINSDTHNYSTNHLDSLPSDFYERIFTEDEDNGRVANGIGVYRWVLCTTPNDFDVKDLLLSPSKDANGNYLYSNNINDNGVNEFNVIFGNIFTTSLSPGVSNEFLWFNGCELLDDTNESEVDTVDEQDTKYLIPGWHNYNNESVFSFIKFVPVYNNQNNKFNEDTALNINYNINVTGNSNDIDYKRNVTVHGAVNCDDLSVSNLTATGEIKNIYTKDDIVGEGGIKLGITNKSKFKFTVDTEGNINASNFNGKDAVFENCEFKESHAESINTNSISIVDTYNNNFISASASNNKIELNEVKKIKIEKNTEPSGKLSSNYALISDLPSVLNGNSNLIITNNQNLDDTLYITGNNSANYNNNYPGDGVESLQGKMTTPDFDSVKNFNMHRIAVKGYIEYMKENFDGNQGSAMNTLGHINNDYDYVTGNNSEKYKAYRWSRGWTSKTDYTFGTSFENFLRTTKNYDDESDNLDYIIFNDILGNKVDPNSNIQDKNDILKAIDAYSICKFTSPDTYKGEEIDEFKSIEIAFSSYTDYLCYIAIVGKCNNGKYPILYNDDPYNSRLTLRLICEIADKTDDNYKLIQLDQKVYNIEYATSSTANDQNSWSGYTYNGEKITDYGGMVRYYAYAFNPSNFKISDDNKSYKVIKDAILNKRKIKFYVFPDFELCAYGQKLKDCVKSVFVSNFVAISHANLLESMNDSINFNSNNKLYRLAGLDMESIDNSGFINNNYTPTFNFHTKKQNDNSSDNYVSTTICNDGIVFRHNDTTFGIGYSKVIVNYKDNSINALNGHWDEIFVEDDKEKLISKPMLFYHTPDNMYEDNGDPKIERDIVGIKYDGKDLKGYARRTNAIPLDDLFDVVNYIKQTDAFITWKSSAYKPKNS